MTSIVHIGIDGGNTEIYAVRSVVEMGKNKTPALIEYGVVGSLHVSNAQKNRCP